MSSVHKGLESVLYMVAYVRREKLAGLRTMRDSWHAEVERKFLNETFL